MNIIEKVSRAIADNITAGLPDGVEIDTRYAARAAIEAMRDEIEARLKHDEEGVIDWIDAALK